MEGYPKRKRGDPTWSAARDDAYAQKERLRGERCLLCLCKRLRDADRREEIIIFYCQSLRQPAADSSPYTGEPLGWRAPALYTGEPAGR